MAYGETITILDTGVIKEINRALQQILIELQKLTLAEDTRIAKTKLVTKNYTHGDNTLDYFCVHQKPFKGGFLLAGSIGKTADECFFCDDEATKR